MDIREKASIAWDIAYYLREAAILLVNLGEADLSDEVGNMATQVDKLESQYTAEADKRDEEAQRDIERTFERSAI